MLAPGPKDQPLQVVDVRDLGAFTLDRMQEGRNDVFGVVGPREPLTWSDALAMQVDVGGAGTGLRVGGRAIPAGATERRGGRAAALGHRRTRGCIRSTRARRSPQGCITARSPRRSRTRSRGTGVEVR